MNIRRVIELARAISEWPGVLSDRRSLLSRAAGDFDGEDEESMNELERKLGYALRLVDIGHGVHNVVKDKTNLSIAYHAVTSEVPLCDAIYGYVLTKKVSAIIVYRAALNFCWRRLTVAKELAHLFSGTVADSMTQGAAAVSFGAKESRRVIPTLETDLDAETAAFYIALEVMIPWSLRTQFNDLRSVGATTYQIAKAFMIPQTFISHFSSDWNDRNTYAGLSYQINTEIDKERKERKDKM